MQLLPHLSYRKQGKQAAFFLLGSATAMEPSAPLLRLHQAGVEWREAGVRNGAGGRTLSTLNH